MSSSLIVYYPTHETKIKVCTPLFDEITFRRYKLLSSTVKMSWCTQQNIDSERSWCTKRNINSIYRDVRNKTSTAHIVMYETKHQQCKYRGERNINSIISLSTKRNTSSASLVTYEEKHQQCKHRSVRSVAKYQQLNIVVYERELEVSYITKKCKKLNKSQSGIYYSRQ